MKESRRKFIKKAGLLTCAAALLKNDYILGHPSNGINLFNINKLEEGKMLLEWENFEGVMKHTFTISGSSRKSTPIVLTKITWNGYSGYGEASMPPYLGESHSSVNSFLKKAATETIPRFSNPFLIEDIMAEIEKLSQKDTAAKASIDIALHDLLGKIIGQPWWKIWGFNPEATPYTSFTIGYDSDDYIINTKIKEASWSKILKVKLGMSENEDKRMITLIRNKTNTPINIDANQGWKDKYYALDMINWLKERDVQMIEQPMPKEMLDDTAWLTQRSPLPIIADEACQRLCDINHLYGAYNGINIKLMKCTGMREAREMISVAKSLRMEIMIGCMTETSVAISAAAQLSPKCKWADLDGNILLSNDCFNGMTLNNGRITLENKPGIGVTKKEKTIIL